MDLLEPSFQTEVLRCILSDHSFLLNNRRNLSDDLFQDRSERELAQIVLEHYDKYRSMPSKTVVQTLLKKTPLKYDTLWDCAENVYSEPARDAIFVADNIRDFVTRSNVREVLINGMDYLKRGEYSAIYESLKKVMANIDSAGGIGEVFFTGAKNLIASFDRKEQFVSTGIYALDERMSGGGVRGTLNVILTPPNRGKTTTLVNIGKYAALQGYKVIHYTTELSAEATQRRYLMSLCRMSKKEIINKKRTAYERILEIASGIQNNNIIVKRYPSYSCTMKDCSDHINLIKNELGFVPDVGVFDYGALFKSEVKYDERRFELSHIYAAMRDLMGENNMVGWTAHQTNRGEIEEEVITYKGLAEDFNIAAIVDTIISVNQTLEEKRDGDARLFLAKNRDDESLITVPIRVDWSRSWVGNVD